MGARFESCVSHPLRKQKTLRAYGHGSRLVSSLLVLSPRGRYGVVVGQGARVESGVFGQVNTSLLC